MLVALVLGCAALTPANFHRRQNEEACRNSEACSPDAFALEYDDVDACADDLDASYELLYRCQREACAFDEDDAADCIANLSGAACEDVLDGDAWTRCDSVFEDCDADAYSRCMDEG